MNTQNIKSRALKKSAFLISLIITILILVISSSHAQEAKPSSQPDQPSQLETKEEVKSGDVHLDKAYFKGYLADTGYILSSPLNWDKWDWVTTSLVVGAAVGLYAYDKDIQDWFRREEETLQIISPALSDHLVKDSIQFPLWVLFTCTVMLRKTARRKKQPCWGWKAS